ncbi:unnamed protein product [Paramecium sonneborni]|uniref:MORN repeat protein n=1 Tax=Paramecium sonneborni TaxID=65129 RepID=A0A8S1LND0_9CILI|nr:unnamed protein product [Paramecium sonneborni]
MGSCNQCIQKQEHIKSGRNQNVTMNQLPQNHQMAIKIQSAYRSYVTRQKFNNLKQAEKGVRNQIVCNSTEDFQIEYHTNSYSPKINQFDESNAISSIINNKKQSVISLFSRQQSLKLQPKESDSFDFEDLDRQAQSPEKISVQSPDKSLRSLKSQKNKLNSFKFKCVLTLEILETNDKIKLQQKNIRLKLDTIKLIGGNIYNGEWLNQLPDGKGKYTFCDSSYYQGDFVKGFFHGKGEFRNKEGANYRGQWQQNKMHGNGTYNYNNGCKYEGNWERDLPNGQGIEWYINGSVYVGSFLNGLKHGQGKLTFIEGETYEGQFEFDNFNGKGTYRWLDGRVYQGEWMYGKMNGKGLLNWPDGRFYNGQYLNDQKHGFGIFCYSDGRKYVGQWKRGLQHGQGEFHKSCQQQITKGIWKSGQLVKLL